MLLASPLEALNLCQQELGRPFVASSHCPFGQTQPSHSSLFWVAAFGLSTHPLLGHTAQYLLQRYAGQKCSIPRIFSSTPSAPLQTSRSQEAAHLACLLANRRELILTLSSQHQEWIPVLTATFSMRGTISIVILPSMCIWIRLTTSALSS